MLAGCRGWGSMGSANLRQRRSLPLQHGARRENDCDGAARRSAVVVRALGTPYPR